MTASKDDLDLWDQELGDAGRDPLNITAGQDEGPVFVTASVSAWQASITVDYDFGYHLGRQRLRFERSSAGGPVVMVWPDGRLTFIDRPEECGDFTADKRAWVARYYAPVDDDEHNGCGCSQDSYYDDDQD